MSERAKVCVWCKEKFWSGQKGYISPVNHNWFCKASHYQDWWNENEKKKWDKTLCQISSST